MKVLVTDGMSPAGKKVITDAGHEVIEKKLSPDELVAEIGNYEAIIIRSATKVVKEVVEAGTNLKCIARAGVGLDNVDREAAKAKGIPVLNTPGASAISVAELSIAHMFAVCRFLNLSNTEMRQGEWPKKEYSKGLELTGKTLGLIGFGNIGREVAKRAIGLGMSVIAHDPFVSETGMDVKIVEKDEILANADIISLHIPFIKEQGATLAKAEFDKMKDGVIIINCARGGVVNEKDLLDALNSGKVAKAGIDVYETEPAGEEQKELINHPAVSATPHIGASTVEAQDRVGIEIAEKVVEALAK